jgi:hypothetical protein
MENVTMATKTQKIEMPAVLTVPVDGAGVRTIAQWGQQARQAGLRNGQAAARNYAMNNGSSAIVWPDGHVSQFVFNRDTGAKTRIRWGKQAAMAKAAPAQSGLRQNYAKSAPKFGW